MALQQAVNRHTNLLLGSRTCGALLIAKFRDQSDNPSEDEQAREKEPVIVKILEDTNCNKTAIHERLVEGMAPNTIHYRGEQQWNDDYPEDN